MSLILITGIVLLCLFVAGIYSIILLATKDEKE